ncbi:hypothetical protein LX36DRAFT_97782 [Colletotrichum falcatum]|nr:hypothetical protein LX36DRAFT_97782 [Colletotrichum falcatum]
MAPPDGFSINGDFENGSRVRDQRYTSTTHSQRAPSKHFLLLSRPLWALRVTDPFSVPITPTAHTRITTRTSKAQDNFDRDVRLYRTILRAAGQASPEIGARELAPGMRVSSLMTFPSGFLQRDASSPPSQRMPGSLETAHCRTQNVDPYRVKASRVGLWPDLEYRAATQGIYIHGTAVTVTMTMTRRLDGVRLTAGTESASRPVSAAAHLGTTPHGTDDGGGGGKRDWAPVLHCIASDALARARVAPTPRGPRAGSSCPVGHGRLDSVPVPTG